MPVAQTVDLCCDRPPDLTVRKLPSKRTANKTKRVCKVVKDVPAISSCRRYLTSSQVSFVARPGFSSKSRDLPPQARPACCFHFSSRLHAEGPITSVEASAGTDLSGDSHRGAPSRRIRLGQRMLMPGRRIAEDPTKPCAKHKASAHLVSTHHKHREQGQAPSTPSKGRTLTKQKSNKRTLK